MVVYAIMALAAIHVLVLVDIVALIAKHLLSITVYLLHVVMDHVTIPSLALLVIVLLDILERFVKRRSMNVQAAPVYMEHVLMELVHMFAAV